MYASVTITNTHGKRKAEGKVEREGGTDGGSIHVRSRCACVRVCVCKRARERERES